jgi:hypothetical protein
MNNSKIFPRTKVILLLSMSLLLTGFPGKTWGEEPISVDNVKMLAELCGTENTSIFSENIIEKNQCGCPPPGPYICIGCFEYTCIGLYSYASLISDVCWLIAFCFLASDCQALCVGLIPESPPFK